MSAPTLQEFLALCDGVIDEGGGRFRALCPCHNDSDPSLCIDPGDRVEYVVICRVCGAPFERIVDALKSGTWATNHDGRKPTKRRPLGQCVAVHTYRRADGSYAYDKLRFRHVDPATGETTKSTPYRRMPPGSDPGEMTWGRGDERPMLYNLPAIAAAEPSKTIYCFEGESDVDAAVAFGLTATCTDGGAWKPGTDPKSKWFDVFETPLHGKERIVICRDNDDSGLAYAEHWASRLHGSVGTVRILLLPGLKEKGDFRDWAAAGGTLEEFVRLANEAPIWSGPGARNGSGPDPDAAARDEWPDPVPLADVRGLPDFPTALFDGWLGDFIDAVSIEMLTPAAAPGLLSLCALSAALARKVAVHVKDNHTEPLNIYAVVVLASGNLKSPIFRLVVAPIEAWERSEASRLKKTIADAEAKRASLAARLKATQQRAARAKDESERRGIEKEADSLAKKLAEHVVPRAPRLLATDVTEESLGILLAANGGRIAIFSDEGGPFRNMAGRYSNSKNSAAFFDTFKHAHNGGTVRVDRVGREPINVPNAAIALGLMVQPSVLRSLKDTPEFRGEGLLARPLYAVPTVPDRDWSAAVGVPFHVAEKYADGVRALLDMPFGSDDRGAEAPHVMELSADALSLVVPFRNEIESRKRDGGDLAHLADWAAKLTGQAIRIAGLIHLSETAGQPEPWRTPVPASAMERAFTFARGFLIPHALGAFSLIGGGATSELAEEVVAWVRRHGHAAFTKRDLHRHLRSHVENPREWDEPLALLVELGWIREKEPEPERRAGRPPEGFVVNPKATRAAAVHAPDRGDAWEGPDHD